MNIAELRAFMADIRVRQAKLDAQMLEANARMISLMHDPVAPTFVIPERELVAHGGLTSREAREVVSRLAIRLLSHWWGLGGGDRAKQV